jgi:hypothetical protein
MRYKPLLHLLGEPVGTSVMRYTSSFHATVVAEAEWERERR